MDLIHKCPDQPKLDGETKQFFKDFSPEIL